MASSRSLADWLALLEQRHPRAIDLGLERCGAAWRRLDSPRPAPLVFTVAGTNGKGSVVAYLDQLLRALGHRAGTYTSPHLLRFNERVTVQGAPLDDGAWIGAFERVEAVRGEISLTYFEFTTLAALVLLADARLDAAVLEVGLGGRLDAVNLVNPDCAVITPIGLDHQEFLGPDRETIAREKAGILRAGVPAVIGDRDPPASLRDCVHSIGAHGLWLGQDFEAVPHEQGWTYRDARHHLELESPALPGRHQFDNAATALAGLLDRFPHAAERPEDLGKALRAARPAGRMQRVAGPPDVWVDVGHNPQAAAAVANVLDPVRGPIHCVLGMLRDKDPGGVARALDERVEQWHCAPLDGPRGRRAAELAGAVRAIEPRGTVWEHGSVAAALEAARAAAGARGQVLVFGSFLTAARALEHLGARVPVPLPSAATDPAPGNC